MRRKNAAFGNRILKKYVDQLLTTIEGENVLFKRNSLRKAGNGKSE